MDVVELFSRSTSKILCLPSKTELHPSELMARAASEAPSNEKARGRRIALQRQNDQEYLAALAAAAVNGSIVMSVNTKLSQREAAELVTRSGADGGAQFADESVPDPYVIFTTSGTTSKPKMVLHTQTSVATHADQVATRFGYGADDVVLMALPLGGTFGLTSLMVALAANATIVMPERFEVATAAAAIEQFGVTAMNGTDDMFHRLLLSDADLSSIKLGGYAAFNSSLSDIVARADQRGATLLGLYGMSEVQGLFGRRDPELPASVRSQPGGTIASEQAAARVVDPDSRAPLPVGAEGELQLRGPSMMAGYLAEGGAKVDRGLTDAAIDADGWFSTGDAGVVDDDRTFRFITRLGDVLRIGGYLVSPLEIESVLMTYPGVTGAQVIAHDMPAGARPVAFVTGSVTAADEAALIAHCQRHLAKFKSPVAVIPLAAFPTTESANGIKIRKVELRQMAARHMG